MTSRSRVLFFVLMGLAACSKSDAVQPNDGAPAGTSLDGGGGAASDASVTTVDPTARPNGPPVETAPPNAPSQRPAFPGQTRAPGHPLNVPFEVRVVAKGLVNAWAITFLPDGAKLVTERPGRMRIIGADGTLSAPLGGVPAVVAVNQGGLLDVVVDPGFATNNLIYFTYSEPRTEGSGNAVARARLVRSGSGGELADLTVIWRTAQPKNADYHFGSRLVFARDGNLFVTCGERGAGSAAGSARDPATSHGKVLRIRPDGSIPTGNPFAGRAGALPGVWSVGHRNPQSAALHPQTGELWTVEHGARGGDEVNVVRAGRDYGWPTVTYGIDYPGNPIGDGITALEGVEQPVYYWDPVIAPSGAAFYDAAAFPAWRGSFFVGSMGGLHLARLTLDGDRVIGEERLLTDRGGRIRDVRVGPAGTLFVSDESAGEILELTPR